jgi:DNA polymerase
MDFSAIEARVLAWLAGEEKVLDIFRSHGKIYEHAAAGIYQKDMDDVTKDERQIGKVAVLALGYGGGIGAFQSMAKVYGVKVEDETADGIKLAWRAAHPNIVQYWKDLEQAAIDAIDWPGMNHKAGPKGREVIFRKEGSFLWCKLPSGRVLCYPYATIQPKPVPWGGTKPVVHFWCVNGTTKKWEETTTYGGSLAENVTQAVARDLLAEALLRMDARGFAIVMHVHDEIVVEIASNSDNDKLHQIEKIMAEVPAWAVGLPVAAEGWRAPRYRK